MSHMTERSRFLNNIFFDRGRQTVSVFNSFGLVFERNILVGDLVEILSPHGNPDQLPSEYDEHEYMKQFSKSDGIVSLQNNVFYCRSGRPLLKHYLHYRSVGEIWIEENDGNVLADPLFRNPPKGDFGFLPDSPGAARGIRPLAFGDCGSSGSYPSVFALIQEAEEVV